MPIDGKVVLSALDDGIRFAISTNSQHWIFSSRDFGRVESPGPIDTLVVELAWAKLPPAADWSIQANAFWKDSVAADASIEELLCSTVTGVDAVEPATSRLGIECCIAPNADVADAA